MMTEKLNYPIVVFFENGGYQPYPTKKDFLVTDLPSISNGQYKNISIVDIKGNQYDIDSYHIIKTYGFLWGYHPLFKNRLFWVKMNLLWKNECSLEVLKLKIISALKNNKIPDSVLIRKDNLIENINNQKNIKDLILIMNE